MIIELLLAHGKISQNVTLIPVGLETHQSSRFVTWGMMQSLRQIEWATMLRPTKLQNAWMIQHLKIGHLGQNSAAEA